MPRSKIPKNAKRVFKGVIWDVYQWRQRLFDGTYAKFEAIRRTGTVVIMPIVGRKIAISTEEQPNMPRTVGLVSGRIERNESPLKAAKRELLEETGLRSDDWELLKADEVLDTPKIDWKIYHYVARNCRKVAEQRLEAGERISIRLVGFDAFMALPGRRNVDPWLARELGRIGNSKRETAILRKKMFANRGK